MKKFLFFYLLSMVTVSGQILYSDNFDQDILTIEPNSAYTPSLVNQNLVIEANGTAGPYATFVYEIHEDANRITIDISSNPKLFFKTKGTNIPTLRIDLQDQNGYVTNLNAQSHRISDEFQIYELDYSEALLDGGYGGPCLPANAPCPVDPTIIQNIQFFVNAAAGGYEGTIEIDWISFGEPLEDIPSPPEFDIRYNQVAYWTGKEKLINIVGKNPFSNKPYSIHEVTGRILEEGTTGTAELWEDSGEYVATVDISEMEEEGMYYFTSDDLQIYFEIRQDGYAEIREQIFKYYYYNRASTALTTEFAGDYARAAGHPDTEVLIHDSAESPDRPVGSTISAPKGWYDAGDYNKYIVNSGISTYTLLAAYEHYSDYYKNLEFNIPEKGGDLPDILDEVLWNLEWMLAMQDPADGGVYHKLTGLTFSGNIMPNEYTMDRYVVQKTTSAALNFAAVTAVASRIFQNFESAKPGFSAQLLTTSEQAYQWAKENPTIYYEQPADVQTGEYGDENLTDEFQWAAVELFITSDKVEYSQDINVTTISEGVPAWPFVSPLALVSMVHHLDAFTDEAVKDAAVTKLINSADVLVQNVENSPMQIAMSTTDYVWGSNGGAGNQLLILIRAYEATKEDIYLNTAYKAMDYLFGRNGTGYCYVTGFGDKEVLDPHHRISVADDVARPVPGMIVGGPHPGQQDGCNYPSDQPSASYVDLYCSYSTNEVTINWNAPLVYAIHALSYYQNEDSILSIGDVSSSDLSDFNMVLYPNPATASFHLQSKLKHVKGTVKLISMDGTNLFEISFTNDILEIPVDNLSPGMYLVEISTGNKTIIKKILKQ